MKEILIVGGGFAGMWAALAAAHEVAQDKSKVKITLVSRDPYMTIRPRLYEKMPETLRTPLRPVFDPVGVSFVEGTANQTYTATREITVTRPGGEVMSLSYRKTVGVRVLFLRSVNEPIHRGPPHAFHASRILK